MTNKQLPPKGKMEKLHVILIVLVSLALAFAIVGAVFGVLGWLRDDAEEAAFPTVLEKQRAIVLSHIHEVEGKIDVATSDLHKFTVNAAALPPSKMVGAAGEEIETLIMQKDGEHIHFKFHGGGLGPGGMIVEAYLTQEGGTTPTQIVAQRPYISPFANYFWDIRVTRADADTLRYYVEEVGKADSDPVSSEETYHHGPIDIPWDWSKSWNIGLVNAGAIAGPYVHFIHHMYYPVGS